MQAAAFSQRCCAQQKPVFVRRQVKALAVAASVPASKHQQTTMQHGRVSLYRSSRSFDQIPKTLIALCSAVAGSKQQH
jgi:hypothetical protein